MKNKKKFFEKQKMATVKECSALLGDMRVDIPVWKNVHESVEERAVSCEEIGITIHGKGLNRQLQPTDVPSLENIIKRNRSVKWISGGFPGRRPWLTIMKIRVDKNSVRDVFGFLKIEDGDTFSVSLDVFETLEKLLLWIQEENESILSYIKRFDGRYTRCCLKGDILITLCPYLEHRDAKETFKYGKTQLDFRNRARERIESLDSINVRWANVNSPVSLREQVDPSTFFDMLNRISAYNCAKAKNDEPRLEYLMGTINLFGNGKDFWFYMVFSENSATCYVEDNLDTLIEFGMNDGSRKILHKMWVTFNQCSEEYEPSSRRRQENDEDFTLVERKTKSRKEHRTSHRENEDFHSEKARKSSYRDVVEKSVPRVEREARAAPSSAPAATSNGLANPDVTGLLAQLTASMQQMMQMMLTSQVKKVEQPASSKSRKSSSDEEPRKKTSKKSSKKEEKKPKRRQVEESNSEDDMSEESEEEKPRSASKMKPAHRG